MKYPAYPKYKPSGVEWLGDVPEHWKLVKLSRVAISRCDGPFGSGLKSEHYQDEGIRVIRLQNIRFARFDDSDRAFIDDAYYAELGDHDVLPGDLLIAGLGDENNPVGRACVAPGSLGPAMVKADCFRFRLDPKETDPQFLAFQLSATAASLAGALATGTTRGRMNLSATASRAVALPPRQEQRLIATYLARKSRELDTLVAKKRRLIAKLKEKRAALISRTVTRGIPANELAITGFPAPCRLKDSGVEWIGLVPEHWDVLKLRRRFRVLDCKHQTVSFTDDGIPVVSIGEVQCSGVNLGTAKKTTFEEYQQMIDGGRKPQRGDLIYSRNATVGAVAPVTTDEPFCMGQDVCLIRPGAQNDRFVLYLLQSHALKNQVESLMIGSTFRRINVSQINSFWLCLPPANEQIAIADYLDRETTKIDRMIEKIETAIQKLQEYRTALITAAVTGKIDVRGEAARDRFDSAATGS